MKAVAKEERRVAYPLVLIFAILSLGIVVGGAFYYRYYERQFRAGIAQQLSAIAELKAEELAQYRKERLGDAATFFKNAAFSGLVRRFLDHPEDAEAQEQLRAWLDKYQTYYQYDRVFLLDAQGVERMSTPVTAAPVSAVVSRRIAEVLRSREIAFQDFHRNEHNQRIYLTLLVPILDGPDHSQALGVLALRIDPETYLYPFIKRWPTPSRTAETLLVRRDGNDVLFLNELKFGTNTALNLRSSIENTNVAAVKVVLGQKGIVEGADYRGVPVLAALRAIPDSPWFLVARMDTAEVYAPLRERLWLTVLLVGVLLAGASAGVGAIRRHQRARFYKERSKVAEVMRASEVRYRRLFEAARDGILILDAETGIVVDVNPFLIELLGYSHEQFLGKKIWELGFFKDIIANQANFAELQQKECIRYEDKPLETADGRQIAVEFVSNVYLVSHQKVIQCNIRDITVRKRAEEASRESQALYYSLVEQLPVGVFRKDPAGRYVLVNSWFCRLKGMKAEEFPGKTPQEVAASEVAKQDPTGRAGKYAAAGGGHHEQIMQTGKPIELVEEYTDADGRKQFVHALKLPVFDSDGKIIGTQGILFDITEIKQAAEALHHEQTLMATLMKTLPDPVYFKDAASRFLRVNPALARKLGLGDPAQVVGKTDADFFTEEHASKALADEQEIIRTGQPLVNIEEKETWPNGSETWVLTTKLPLRNDAGRIIGTCGISSNITERKRAEKVLRLSEERLLKVVTQTRCILNSGQVEGPENWRERALNPETPFHWDFPVQNLEAAQKIVPLELAAGERYQQAWTRSRNRADHAQMNWNSGNAFLNDLPFYRNEFRCIDKHGAGHWMQQFVTVRKLAENRWEIFGITTDISDLKRVETELRRSETGLQATLESTADGILAVDNKGKVIKANRRFAELWRIPQSLMDVGDDRVLLDFVLKQLSDPDAFLKKVQLLYSTDAVEMDTLVFKDGRIFERYTSPMMMEGSVIGRVWSFRDITERKRQEEELKQKNSELERFTYTVSHDLKSPLVTVKTFLGYLEQDLARPNMERVKQDVTYMQNATDKMGQLLDELLNLARVGRKKNPAVRVTFRELAQEAVRLVAGRISTGGVKVQVADAVVTLEGDRPRLMEIWQNLVENACKFMGNQPQPQVGIGVEQRGPETVFFVRDNGAGIDPRYQAKVFGLFEQLNPKGEGTGMGLALVKRIVELYEGRIWVESAGPGRGANFLFTLPGAVILEPEQSS
jgi:PAS domain S-box-containing protein